MENGEPMAELPPTTRSAATFERLLQPVLPVAYGVALRMSRNSSDAEDLVQEAALLAYRAFHTFQEGTNFKAWYLRILTNCFFAKYRKKKRQPEIIDLEDAPPLYLMMQSVGAGIFGPPEDPAACSRSRSGSWP